MVSSNMSQSASGQPRSDRSLQKERSQPTLWSVAAVFFLLGATVSALTIWQLHKLYRATVAPVVVVEGQVQAKYAYHQDSNEITPAPSGYFIESTGMGRIYLTGKSFESYVGQPVKAQGSVAGICGPKSIPCYPLVEVRDIDLAETE